MAKKFSRRFLVPRHWTLAQRLAHYTAPPNAHLWIGTHADNMADKARKGRQYRPQGVKHHHAKLTEVQVREIRAATESHQVIARRYGVSAATVSLIQNRINWSHLD